MRQMLHLLPDKVEIIAEAPADSLQTPVLYPVGLIEDKEASEDDTKAAEAFLDYVESDAAIKVFEMLWIHSI